MSNTSSFKELIKSNLVKTMTKYSYTLTKSLELEKGFENCVFKKDEKNIILFTFNYTPASSSLHQNMESHYLNNGFYRKEINHVNGYYGIINESGKEWEKFTYLENNGTLIMTISRLISSTPEMDKLIKDYSKN